MKELFEAKLVPLEQGIASICEHLQNLNGQVAKNTKFRVQAYAVWALIGVLFTAMNNLDQIKRILIALI